jgi:hypothetical protein
MMETPKHPRRAVMRLLGAMARPRASVELVQDDAGEVCAVRIVRSAGETPDVLHRAGGEAWREAVAAALVGQPHEGGHWQVTGTGRALLSDHGAAAGRDAGESDGERPLVGAAAADAAERQRPARPVVNLGESPLAWLRRRRDRGGAAMISDLQFDAGERLRADFERGGLMPRVTANWDALGSGRSRSSPGPHAGVELRDGALSARDRVNRALAAVGPELGHVLLDVCCHLKGLEQIEREAMWPQRSGKIVLQVALSALARHYGMEREGVAAGGSVHIRHWGASDYRPGIDAGD